ncbi:MAG TPA: neutral/alkaline non-lysosomal ceramidase N-terminal domain-containing protein, partial [Armatimonadota bacterium]|nr:neutral/alkaline non-lysosomal ceramidase N-terminal domain-containing protein [Armatimonadota bacterium]
FAKTDITPRVGVQLYGYGPFLNPHSIAVRDPLFARAMAVSDGETAAVLVSCDLVGVSADITDAVRERVAAETDLPGEHVCVHCVHTHSGPRTKTTIGWGADDPPYLELLPGKIASACVAAIQNLQPATISHAVVPCEGLGYNREDDVRSDLADCLREDWRPAKPELTDTEAHVLRVDADGETLGFASYFSCHPVVGPSPSRYIHGDFVGVATNNLERETPGSVGLFLQGCQGDINSCVVHYAEQESLLALDVIAGRYARQIRPGIRDASPLSGGEVRVISRECKLTHDPVPEAELREMLAEREAILNAPGASDEDGEVRMATVYAIALRKELARLRDEVPIDDAFEIQGLRIGDLLMVGAPFEIMNRYKTRIQEQFDQPVLVMGLCNDARGYAPRRESFAKEGNYAARVVPYLLGYSPFAPSVEDELVAAMTSVARELSA